MPKEFLHSVGSLFGKQFKNQLHGSTFLVFADLYPSEVVLCISLTHPKSLRAASMHLSSDLPKNAAKTPERVTETLKGMVDVAAEAEIKSISACLFQHLPTQIQIDEILHDDVIDGKEHILGRRIEQSLQEQRLEILARGLSDCLM